MFSPNRSIASWAWCKSFRYCRKCWDVLETIACIMKAWTEVKASIIEKCFVRRRFSEDLFQAKTSDDDGDEKWDYFWIYSGRLSKAGWKCTNVDSSNHYNLWYLKGGSLKICATDNNHDVKMVKSFDEERPF